MWLGRWLEKFKKDGESVGLQFIRSVLSWPLQSKQNWMSYSKNGNGSPLLDTTKLSVFRPNSNNLYLVDFYHFLNSLTGPVNAPTQSSTNRLKHKGCKLSSTIDYFINKFSSFNWHFFKFCGCPHLVSTSSPRMLLTTPPLLCGRPLRMTLY